MRGEATRRCLATAAVFALFALLLSACSSCSGGGGDADTETGSESDSEIVFGVTTPCANAARESEVCIPGGNYLMGCVPSDDECEDNELPLVMTTLSPFFIDREEATIGEVIAWMNDVKDDPGFITDPYFAWTDGTTVFYTWGTAWHIGASGDDTVPIVLRDSDGNYYFNPAANSECSAQGGAAAAAGGFSWLGAKLFCEWKGMQLPTEAQWEAAARGQTKRIWPCGSDVEECWEGMYACCTGGQTCSWAYECYCCAPFEVDFATSCESPFGIKGMYGNAEEWVDDTYTPDHSACSEGCVDPHQSEISSAGVGHIRKGGGVYGLDQSWLRISRRWDGEEDVGGDMTGVRCARPDAPFVQPDAGSTASDGGK